MPEEIEHLQGEGLFSNPEREKISECVWDTWKEGSAVMHCVGLLQFWWYGYTDDSAWCDPPRPSAKFSQWLETHGCTLLNGGAFGPPMIRFPSEEVAQKFRYEWHEPGAVQRRHYEAWCNQPRGHFSTHEEMDAAMDRAKEAKAEWVAARLAGQQQET